MTERRETLATVDAVEVQRSHDGRTIGFKVTLSNGWTYSMLTDEKPPRVGDRKLVTIDDDDQGQLDLSDMRAAVLDFGRTVS